MEQHLFQFEEAEVSAETEPILSEVRLPSVTNDTRYASVKSISLVYEGSLRERPCLTSTEESKTFFKRYWQHHPGNDQERFVVAWLDTKHRVQCVVVVTVGTLDASLVNACRHASSLAARRLGEFTQSCRVKPLDHLRRRERIGTATDASHESSRLA